MHERVQAGPIPPNRALVHAVVLGRYHSHYHVRALPTGACPALAHNHAQVPVVREELAQRVGVTTAQITKTWNLSHAWVGLLVRKTASTPPIADMRRQVASS